MLKKTLFYVSTDSMQPNKGSVSCSEIPDSGSLTCFQIGDTLLSNIRPYFKKIWLADKKGVCSNDVLVFKTNELVNSEFLYGALCDDNFFEYVMSTSKGTKMPRGDKSAIMNYEIPLPPLATQTQIARILSAFDSKIEVNNKLNAKLEELARAVFEERFGGINNGDGVVGDYLTPKRGRNLLKRGRD